MKYTDEAVIWSSLPVAAVVLDAGNLVLHVNPLGELFLNASQSALVGQDFSKKVSEKTDISESFDRVRNGQASLLLHEVKISLRSRAPVKCSLQVAPLNDGSGGLLVLLQTQAIAGRLEQALQINSATKTAVGMSDILAHEIKNPLAGITGAAQLLAMGLSGSDLEMTDLIVQESRRILGLLEQVEQFGDLRPPEFRTLNIHDVLERAKASASVGFASHMLFEDNYDPSLPSISGDSDQLLQVFGNLFKNATEAAGKASGRIFIKTYYEIGLHLPSEGGQRSAVPLQIEISDDGPGIPDAVAEKLFEPFVSGRENGTGLGLALVSKIISQHFGSVSVNRDSGRTVFRISLPLEYSKKGR